MSSQDSISGAQKLRRVASKILQKIKLSTGKEDIDLGELGPPEIQAARFVAFTRPEMAPQIIDLKAMRQNNRPQLPRIDTQQPRVQRSQADLNSHEIDLQRSFESLRAPTKTGTPRRRNSQQVFAFEATSDSSASAVLDDIEDYAGCEMLDGEDSDLNWSLLDLSEKVYGRLANESRHSLI